MAHAGALSKARWSAGAGGQEGCVVGEPRSERAAAGSGGRRAAGLAQLSAQTRTNPGIGERGARGGIDAGGEPERLGHARARVAENWTGRLVQMVIGD
jgi:hypothetical protein